MNRFVFTDGTSVPIIDNPDLVDWPKIVADATGIPVPSDIVLLQYQQQLLLRAFGSHEKVTCICGRDVRDWKRRFHLTMRKQIWALVETTKIETPFRLERRLAQLRERFPGLGLPSRSDETKLPNFNMLERHVNNASGRDSHFQGMYSITQFAVDFCEGKVRAPKYSYFYNGVQIAVSDEMTSLDDPSDRFDWKGLMEGTGG